MQKFMRWIGSSIIPAIIVVFFLVNPAGASEHYEFITKWGGLGSGEGRFDFPSAIATDGDDNIYVADDGNCRVQKFTPEGEYLTEWGGCGPGVEFFFSGLVDLAADDKGNVYVLQSYRSSLTGETFCRVRKFTAEGEFIATWGSYGSEDGQFLNPQAIDTDSEGNVFVADSITFDTETFFTTSYVHKFNSEGEFMGKWGNSGSYINGEVDFLAMGLAIDDEDTVYISGLFTIYKTNTDGEFISEWNHFGLGEILLPISLSITTDSEKNVYLITRFYDLVKKFTSGGEFLASWSLYSPVGEFGRRPQAYDVAVDSKGNVYVLDIQNDVVQKFAKKAQNGQPCPSEKIYGNQSAETKLLRNFRDHTLSKTPEGREIIQLYYEWSPAIVRAMERDEEFKGNVKALIDGLLLVIRNVS